MVSREEEFWLAMHITDSAFPGGALANSQGLESAVYHGLVCKSDKESMKSFINLTLEQAKSLMLPFVRTSHQLHMYSEKEVKGRHFRELDNLYHCMLSNEISRRSSTNQGKCFHRVMTESFPQLVDLLSSTNRSSGDHAIATSAFDPLNYHFAPIFGLICGELGISLTITDRMFMRMIMRDLISAAARLNIVGPLEGSLIQAQYSAIIEALLKEDTKETAVTAREGGRVVTDANISTSSGSQMMCTRNDRGSHDSDSKNPPERLTSSDGQLLFYNDVKPIQSAPILDLVQSRHDVLYSRMFNS
jgi:urease accessory protein